MTACLDVADVRPANVWEAWTFATGEGCLPISGYGETYLVTDQGLVISRHQSRPLKPMVNHKGYLTVGLYLDGKRTIRPIHRLVLDAFVGPEPTLMGRHKNGNPADNRLENLEWGTNSDNQRDSLRHGTHRSLVTHCPMRHPYSGDNLIQTAKQRVCRECGRIRSRENQRRKAAERRAGK